MKHLLLSLLVVFSISFVSAQNVDELKAMVSDKAATLDALQGEIDALNKQIAEFPGWKIGGVGTIGFNALSNNNWYALGTPNSSNSALGVGFNGFANQDQDKYFWRNGLNINLSRAVTKVDKSLDDQTIALTNGLDVSSLFGYKLAPKWALSAEGKWTSSLVEFVPGATVLDDKYSFALNSPGVATISAGLTWTPISDLVVIFHPLGYQKNWPGDLISSPGCKIGASYAAEIIPGVSWSSNLSAFIPYTNGDGFVDHAISDTEDFRTEYGTGDLTNWEWINGFSTSIFKGLGVSFNLGLKGNRQQADSGRLLALGSGADLSDNPLQSFYTLGLGYTF